ncbi:MAG: HigA family addiction module antidote protein [Magnetococcales bacterium]|nr:HigA family addiction module antidote protein [Magnetococcales bacterium]
MSNSLPVHPGEHLAEFLEEFCISQCRLAKEINVSPRRINEIVRGRRGVSVDMALRLGQFFRTTPEFWMNLQSRYVLKLGQDRLANDLSRIHSIQDISPVALIV